ncbi:MAG: thiamine-phosphate kinase [SAR202 cluster bacterium]|nr:thiamine-phosphate kinase [SAR202 cluster bacterium]
MQVKDLGEFGLIERLIDMAVRQRAGPDNGGPLGFRLTVDAGDDTAAWRTGVATELFTTDTMVEGVHFTRETTPWRDVGWKSMASNISDIAAMGGLPTYALVTLGLPPDTAVADMEEMYRGMLEINNQYGVAIVGGDIVRSPVFFITVALTGVQDGQPLLRSTARPGDQVGVTGYVGSSGGGLRLMLDKTAAPPGAAEYLRQAHRRPQPAVAQGRVLAQAGVLTAMDISDGLADDLSKLCKASGVSARISASQVPVHPMLRAAFPSQCLELALGGGEDYLLLFTAPPHVMAQVMPQLPEGAAVIGEILAGPPGQVLLADQAGRVWPVGPAGWDHFRGDPAPGQTIP